MSRELARDILKAVQNATNHFVASKTAKVGSTIRLTHPVGKAIFAQALTPLSGSCLVFEQNGQWFAVAGAERTETNSTTVVSRRSRPRGKASSTEFEVAYLFFEEIKDDSELPFIVTKYRFDLVESGCRRTPGSDNDTNYSTLESCQVSNVFSTLGTPYNNYINHLIYTANISAPGGQSFTIYSYEGDNSDAITKLQNLNAHQTTQLPAYKIGDGRVYEDETYLVTAFGNSQIILVYQRLVSGGVEYMLVGYRRDTGVSTGVKYCKSTRTYLDAQDNEIVKNQKVFPFPHSTREILAYTSAIDSRLNEPNKDRFNDLNPSLSISYNCSHATLNDLATEEERLKYAFIFDNSFDFGQVVSSTSFPIGGTGTISGSELINGALNISATASGSVPSSVEFHTAYFNGRPQNLERFEYAGYLPIDFINSYLANGVVLQYLRVSVFPRYRGELRNTGKRIFYFQRKNEQPIELLELPLGESYQTSITSSLLGFNIVIKVGSRRDQIPGYTGTGSGLAFYRVFLIEILNSSRTPKIDIYNFLDDDIIPVPENNWLSIYYNYWSRRDIETSPSVFISPQDALTFSSTLRYWHNPLYPAQFIFVKFNGLATPLTTNINSFDLGKTLFYFEASDLRDQDPILYIEPLTEPVFLNSFTIGYQATRNARFIISAFLTGNFSNKRVFKVSQLPPEEQTPGELLEYSSPTAFSANLYPLNLGIDLASLSTAELESVIERHSLLAIIPYQAIVTKKTFVSQQVNFPLADVFGGD